MNTADFMTLVKFLINNGVEFELNNVENRNGEIIPTILIYEQEIEVKKWKDDEEK